MTIKHVLIEKGIPSSELKVGDVYRVVIGHRLLACAVAMKVISMSKDEITLMEMPFSKIHFITKLNNLTFLEKVED